MTSLYILHCTLLKDLDKARECEVIYCQDAVALSPSSLSLFIDREAREIMYLVASVSPSVRLSVCHYQSKGFVCVSVIIGHVRIIARRRSIGF